MCNMINIKADCEQFPRTASCLKVFNIGLLLLALFLAAPACSGSSGPTTDNGTTGNGDNNQNGNGGEIPGPGDLTGTGIAFDTDFTTPGLQIADSVTNPGPGDKIGFAVYIYGVESIGGYTITLTWDGEMAEFRASSSSPSISDDTMNINGSGDIVFVPEKNILMEGDAQLLSMKHGDTPGSYSVSYVQTNGEPPVATTGVLYQAVYRIAKSGDFDINVDVKIADSEGKVETDLPRQVFHVVQ